MGKGENNTTHNVSKVFSRQKVEITVNFGKQHSKLIQIWTLISHFINFMNNFENKITSFSTLIRSNGIVFIKCQKTGLVVED